MVVLPHENTQLLLVAWRFSALDRAPFFGCFFVGFSSSFFLNLDFGLLLLLFPFFACFVVLRDSVSHKPSPAQRQRAKDVLLLYLNESVRRCVCVCTRASLYRERHAVCHTGWMDAWPPRLCGAVLLLLLCSFVCVGSFLSVTPLLGLLDCWSLCADVYASA